MLELVTRWRYVYTPFSALRKLKEVHHHTTFFLSSFSLRRMSSMFVSLVKTGAIQVMKLQTREDSLFGSANKQVRSERYISNRHH